MIAAKHAVFDLFLKLVQILLRTKQLLVQKHGCLVLEGKADHLFEHTLLGVSKNCANWAAQ